MTISNYILHLHFITIPTTSMNYFHDQVIIQRFPWIGSNFCLVLQKLRYSITMSQ